jgi:dTDP-4-amino-4,6-dideoxygalactose transaminase
MRIKLVDLAAQNEEILKPVNEAFAEIHQRAAYVGGAQVKAFEEEFAQFLGIKRAVGVSSGTDAIRLALIALGAGPGDEVITAPMTFIATAAAISQTGALPVFADVDPETGNISVKEVIRYLRGGRFHTPRGPKAIVPIHLYGNPAALLELKAVADEYSLHLVEDACQAHGARIQTPDGWKSAGTIGAAGCFSFYPGKNLGAWGDAGAVVTNDAELAERIEALRDHGRISHYAHETYGYNARIDSIQAAVLRAKLARLADWNDRRREVAAKYRRLLAGLEGLALPTEETGTQGCYHLFVVRSNKRDAIRQALLAKQIECGIHYPVPLHLQMACRSLGYRAGDFPVSERIADTVLSLPMHPHLGDTEIAEVSAVVRKALKDTSDMFAGRPWLNDPTFPPRNVDR